MFVRAVKVDFLIDSRDVLTASLGCPEIPGACQSRRGNLDVSIFSANSDVVAIDEVQRSVFRNDFSIAPIDLGFPADILQRIVHRIAGDDVGVALVNSAICLDVYSICLYLSIVESAFSNLRVRAIDNFHSFFGKVIDDRLAAFCDVVEVRLGDARNLCFTCYRVAIAVDVGHGDGTIITYRIGISFDMDIFAFSNVLNLCYCRVRDIGEVRICQPSSFKFNLTICSGNGNMVTSNKVDFLIDSIDVLTASLGSPADIRFNRVIDTINRQSCCSISRPNGADFRACHKGLRNFLSIRRVGNTDIGILTTRSATISKGQCPIDSRAGRTITITHEGNGCRRIVRAHIYGLNIVMIEGKVIVPQDVEVFLVFGYPIGIHRSTSVIDFSPPIT